MSNEKVSWEYTNGLKSFLNLLNMIQSALTKIQEEDTYIKKTPVKRIGASYAGFTINGEDFWVGVIYSEMEKIYFEYLENFLEKCKNMEKYSALQKDPDGNPSKVYDFNESYFLALTKEEQKKAIYEFIKNSINFAKN